VIRKILLAFDGSEPSRKALSFAMDLARNHNAELAVLTVAEVPQLPEDVETTAILEQSQAAHQKLLESVGDELRSSGLQASLHLAVGHPAHQILGEASRLGVDVLVLGHRGRGLLDRWRLGSVTHRVISYAECAVTVVR